MKKKFYCQMMKLIKLCWVAFIVIYYSAAESTIDNGHPTDEKEKGKKSTFVPTDEWQTVEDTDQPLPPGLHYRMNLETGKKEVKLIKPSNNYAVITSVPEDEVNKDTENVNPVSDLKGRLENLPGVQIETTPQVSEFHEVATSQLLQLLP